jgi:hypothetical protein
MSRIGMIAAALWMALAPAAVHAQITFQKTEYHVAMGDSVAAGEGAMPVTNGYAYRLYDQGVFGQKQVMDFANLAVRGGRSWEFLNHQVPQVLCTRTSPRPTVLTVTVGAIDFLRGDDDILGIAARVAEGINRLLNNGTALVASPVLEPTTGLPCPALSNVTILVSNYYSIPHPDPVLNALLDQALRGFDQALRFFLSSVNVPAGSRLAVVDLYTPSIDKQGLVLIQRRLGFTGPFDFEVHPTNAGHAFIAAQFAATWKNLP